MRRRLGFGLVFDSCLTRLQLQLHSASNQLSHWHPMDFSTLSPQCNGVKFTAGPHCSCLLAFPLTAQLSSSSTSSPTALGERHTYFRVTLRLSGIFVGKRVQGTLAALGLQRRMQTVYHLHTPEATDMILADIKLWVGSWSLGPRGKGARRMV
jgi:ribosomal protein L30/L7E